MSSKRAIVAVVLIIVLLVICIALAVALGVVASIKNDDSGNYDKDTICSTSDCMQVAGYVASNLDTSVDPCDDFYTYSCGGWMKKNFIVDGTEHLDVYQLVDNARKEELEAILNRKISDDAPEYEKKLKTLYQACMDDDKRSESHDTEIKEYIDSKLGGWYGFDPTVVNNWDFEAALVSLHVDLNVRGVLCTPWQRKVWSGSEKFTIEVSSCLSSTCTSS